MPPPRRRVASTPATGTTGISSGDRATVEELGTVKWYNADKGFGFIAPDQGGKDIFVHALALERASIMGLAEGQRVAVDVAQGQGAPKPSVCGLSEPETMWWRRSALEAVLAASAAFLLRGQIVARLLDPLSDGHIAAYPPRLKPPPP